jgi:hypothetical protein
MFDGCTTGDTAHIDTILRFCHTRVNSINIFIHALASPSGRNVNYDEKQLSGGGGGGGVCLWCPNFLLGTPAFIQYSYFS